MRPLNARWRLLHVASINRVKDQPTLLRALRLVLLRNRDVQLDRIGMDTMGKSLQRTAAQMGLEGNVRFLGFNGLLPFYRQAHLFVQSSLHSLPNSLGGRHLRSQCATRQRSPRESSLCSTTSRSALVWDMLRSTSREPTTLTGRQHSLRPFTAHSRDAHGR